MSMRRGWPWARSAVRVALLSVAGCALCFVAVHRALASEWALLPGFSRGVRRFMRGHCNPAALAVAARLPIYYVVLRHTGRRTGKSYATPVVAIAAAGTWYVPLTYGRGTDWCRNVLAWGEATIARRAGEVHLHEPRVVPTGDVLGRLPWRWRLPVWAAGIPWVLALRERRAAAVAVAVSGG